METPYVSEKSDRKAGSALGVLLGERGCAAPDAAGRTLFLTLLRLHELGALEFEPRAAGAVHRARPQAEPGPVVRSLPAQAGQTPHAYNVGSLFASHGDAE